jgi:MFS family permease
VGVGGVLDGGFDLLRSHFGVLVGLAGALLLPLQLVDLWASVASGRSAELDTSPLLAALGSMDSTMPVTWLVVALRVVVLSFLGLMTGVLVSDSLADRVRPARSVLAAAGRRWWVALLVPVLCVPVKMLTACLVYVGFFLGDALLMCASVVAGAERAGPLRSFGRSWTLGWRSFGTALGVALGSFVISAVLQVSLYAGPVLLASFFVSSESMLLVVQQIALLSLLVTQPLTAAIAARAYVEFRCRSEALDLTLRRRDLELVP